MKFPKRQPRTGLWDELRTVVAGDGPFLSVYVDLSDRSSAPHRRFLESVDREQVPTHVIDRVEGLIHTAEHGDDGLFACLASSQGPLVATSYPDPPIHDVIETAALPRLAPIIESEQGLIHHLIAIVDDVGLTLIAAPRHGQPVRETMIGNNPDGAAELIARVAQMTDTSLVVIVGSSDMLDAIHPLVLRDGRLFCPVLRLESNGTSGSQSHELADELVRQVADRSARRVVDALRVYRYFESHDAGLDGVVATVEALRDGRASMLLVHDDPDDERQGWFGSVPTQLGHDLAGVGDSFAAPQDQAGRQVRQGRLVDVVIRSALAQNVPIMVVPALPDDRLADGMGVVIHVEGFADTGLIDLVER